MIDADARKNPISSSLDKEPALQTSLRSRHHTVRRMGGWADVEDNSWHSTPESVGGLEPRLRGGSQISGLSKQLSSK